MSRRQTQDRNQQKANVTTCRLCGKPRHLHERDGIPLACDDVIVPRAAKDDRPVRYEWRDGEHGRQLWDCDRNCWVIWRTISGKIGTTDDLADRIVKLLNLDARGEEPLP